MKKNHRYYDLQELEERWTKYDVCEKNLLKWGSEGQLQFYTWLTPSYPQVFISIECGHTIYVEELKETIPLSPCTHKEDIHYGDRNLFKLHTNTLDQLLNPVLNGKASPWIREACERCDDKVTCKLLLEEVKDGWGVYTTYNMNRQLHSGSSTLPPGLSVQDIFKKPTITKDDLVVCRCDVLKLDDQLERDYSALTDSPTDDESGNNQVAKSAKIASPIYAQNNENPITIKKESWHDQVEPIVLPGSTQANQIAIRFDAYDTVIISIAGESKDSEIEKKYESLGFKNNQGRKDIDWIRAWILLKNIALNDGVYTKTDIFNKEGQIDGSQNEKVVQRFKDTLKKVNDRLRYAIPTLGDKPPIKFNPKKDRWESCFTLGLTPSYYSELNGDTPSTDNDPDILMLMTNRQGHIHDRSTTGIEDHDIKD